MAKLLELQIAYANFRREPNEETAQAFERASTEAAREYPLATVKEFLAELEQQEENSPWLGNPA